MSETTTATGQRLHDLRKVTRKDRANCHGVEWRDGDRRRFRFFKTEPDRDAFYKGHVKAAAVEDFNLTEWLRWLDLKAECSKLGIEPERAVQVARQQRAVGVVAGVTLTDATQGYLAACRERGRSDDYLRHLKSFFARLVACWGAATPILDIDADAVQVLFDQLDVGPVTKKNYRAYARALFGYAMERNWLTAVPTDRLVTPDVVVDEPGILTPDQTRALLAAADAISRELSALLALQLFAGLRNANVTRLVPENIDIKHKTILIPADQFKTKRRHLIEDPAGNLWPWLRRVRLEDVCGWTARNYNWRKGQAFKAAGIAPPKNCLRHSFASYKCALDGSAEKASYILGHQNPREIWQSYKGVATRAAALDYFKIKPEGN